MGAPEAAAGPTEAPASSGAISAMWAVQVSALEKLGIVAVASSIVLNVAMGYFFVRLCWWIASVQSGSRPATWLKVLVRGLTRLHGKSVAIGSDGSVDIFEHRSDGTCVHLDSSEYEPPDDAGLGGEA